VPTGSVGWRSLLALGVSGGLLPCPEALMVLLITIAAHRVLFGLMLIVAFSTGLAGVLVGFGLLLVYARGLFQRVNVSNGWVPRVLPVASALVIVAAGMVITAQALPQVV
jgi:nickel/cobalt transporter (NicO) family protein